MDAKIYNKAVQYIGTPTEPSDAVVGLGASNRNVTCATFNIDSGGTVSNVTKKTDLLFYSRANSVGKVVTTLVYVRQPKTTTDIGGFAYSPFLAYYGYDFSAFGSSVECCTNYEWFNTVRSIANPGLVNIDPYIEPLEPNKYPMNVIQKTGMIDGWYTMVSAGLSNVNTSLSKGSLYVDSEDVIYVATKDNDTASLKPIKTVIAGTSDLYLKYLISPTALTTSQKFPQFIKVDFFVINKLATLVNSFMTKDEKIMYNTLSKISAMEYSAIIGRFDLAQLILQSEEFKILQNGL